MKSNLFIGQLMTTPWAMEPNVLHAYAKLLARSYGAKESQTAHDQLAKTVEFRHPSGVNVALDVTAQQIRDAVHGSYTHDAAQDAAIQAAAPRAARSATGSIAVLGLYGPIMQRAGMMDMCTGGTSTQAFTQSLRSAMTDDTVSQILIDIDSPGGSVFGVAELAAEIRAARGTKPIIGVANSMAASAAYWIGSACSEFYCTPSGQVGSIGVIAAHEDVSKALEAEGVNVTLITAGKYKAEGSPYGPLDEEALRSIQSDIDGYYADFTSAVAKGRGVSVDAVRSDMGQGRMLRGDAAMSAKMIDGVMNFDDVVKKMQRSAKASAGGRSARANAAELALMSL